VDINLVRVTSSRLVPVLTTDELASALHIRAIAIMDIYAPRVDAHGDIYFVASILPGCQNRVLERTPEGAIRQIRVLTSRSGTCS
jgi:hypothetical protein